MPLYRERSYDEEQSDKFGLFPHLRLTFELDVERDPTPYRMGLNHNFVIGLERLLRAKIAAAKPNTG